MEFGEEKKKTFDRASCVSLCILSDISSIDTTTEFEIQINWQLRYNENQWFIARDLSMRPNAVFFSHY